jgi:ribosomal protein S12 methylthiotransferase accessory factor
MNTKDAILQSNIRLARNLKKHTKGLDKAIAPADTVQRVKTMLKDLDIQIVRDIIRIDTGRLNIPVYVCRSGKDSNIPSPKTMGKGPTAEQSEASALMEMMERYSHANFPGPGFHLRGTVRDIQGETIPSDACFYCPDRYANATEENKDLFASLPFAWVPAHSLINRSDVLIPYEWFADIQGTNGLSAGNTMEETVLQGLCEVVERHVCARVNVDKQPVPTIDFASVQDPTARELIGRFLRHRIELVCKDFSLDTGIPTVAGIAFDPSSFPNSEIVYCAGTATHPEKALIRVLTEIQQMAVDFFKQDYYEGGILPKFRHPNDFEFLFDESDPVPIGSLPDVSSEDLFEEIQNCTDALNRIGFEPLVVNLSHPVLKIPAVFVIVPGSELYEMSSRRLGTDYYLGRRLKFIGRPEEAIAMFDRSAEQYPESIGHCTLEIADCLRFLGRWEEAMAAYKSASFQNLDRAMKFKIFRSLQICAEKLRLSQEKSRSLIRESG